MRKLSIAIACALATCASAETFCSSASFFSPAHQRPQFRQQVYEPPQRVQKRVHKQQVRKHVQVPVPVPYDRPIADQGTTVYGYPYGVARQFQHIDLGEVLNQSQRLVTQAQQLAGQAHAEFTASVQQTSAAQQKLAAAALFSEGFSKALAAAETTTSPTTFTFHVAPAPAGDGYRVELEGPAAASGQLKALIAQRCADCHDGETEPPVSSYRPLQILRAIFHADPDKRMPRGGEPLSDSEIGLFIQGLR